MKNVSDLLNIISTFKQVVFILFYFSFLTQYL